MSRNRTRYHSRHIPLYAATLSPAPRTSRGLRKGVASRYTARQIEQMRNLYDAIAELRRQRDALCLELGIDQQQFNRYGRRTLGHKPAPESKPTHDTIDWVASDARAE